MLFAFQASRSEVRACQPYIQTCNPAALRPPYSHTTLQPYNPTVLQPYSHKTLQPYRPTAIQPYILTTLSVNLEFSFFALLCSIYLENIFDVYFRLFNTSAENCIASGNYNVEFRSIFKRKGIQRPLTAALSNPRYSNYPK